MCIMLTLCRALTIIAMTPSNLVLHTFRTAGMYVNEPVLVQIVDDINDAATLYVVVFSSSASFALVEYSERFPHSAGHRRW